MCFFYFQELTGKLPPEYPATPGENPPLIRRRIGTAFSLNARTVSQNNVSVTANLCKSA